MLLTTFSAVALFVAAHAGAQGPASDKRQKTEIFNGRKVAAGQAIVKFRNPSDEQSVAHVKRDVDADMERKVGRAGARLLRSRSKDTATLIRELSARGDVLYAEPNYIISLADVPNDPRFSELWALQNTGYTNSAGAGTPGADVGAVSAWDVSKGSRDNVVAVVDTGIDYTHPDLAANMWSAPAPFTVNIGGQIIRCEAGTHGFNAITKTCDPADEYDHGTHVAGVIGAAGNNGVAGVGVNWTAAVMGIKFIDATGSGTLSDAIDAIEFAIQAKQALGSGANVRVLSNSWGWNGEASQALLDQINHAGASDMLFVAGAGNGGADQVGDDNDVSPFYPASYDAPNVVAVAATDNKDALASFSNFGANRVHLGAPGVLIYSTIMGGRYDWWSGTSMATPHVSGAAALVLSRCSLGAGDLRHVLLNNVDQVPSMSGITKTGGRLNVNKAIRACADLTKPANSGPAVELTQPYEGDSFTAPAVITIAAEASDSDGAVSRVDFYSGTQLIGTDSESPYNTNWHVQAAGHYPITAVAIDNLGATATSRPVNVIVTETVIPEPTPTPAQRVNFALSAHGAAATASSTLGTGWPASGAINGDRRGLNLQRGGGWADATSNRFPDWLQVDFSGVRTIDEVSVFTVQDAYASPAEPTESMTFTQYGNTALDVQYWTGSAWQTVSNGNITSNDKVWRKVTFPPVTTSKIRVVVNSGLAGYSRIVEVEAWGIGAAPRVNVALSSQGATAGASSILNAKFPTAGVNDGDRRGANWGAGGGWADATAGGFPDWVEVAFTGSKTVDEINVFTVQDAYASPAEPTEAMTFRSYGLTAYEVQYWDGSGWRTVSGGVVTGNDKVWRKFTFSPLTTTKIRVLTRGAVDGSYSRVTEIEAWGSGSTPPVG